MQLLVHVSDELGLRFKRAVPARLRSAFVRRLIEDALPPESDPLYQLALQVEAEASGDLDAWEVAVGDGLHGPDASGDRG